MSTEDSNAYVVLKGADDVGPFDEAALRTGMAAGKFSGEDLVRREAGGHWMPLSRLLSTLEGPAGEEVQEEYAEEAGFVQAEAGGEPQYYAAGPSPLDVRRWFTEHPAAIGGVCVALAGLSAFLVRWPLALCAPWMIGGVVGGFMLILRQRPLTGCAIALGSLLLPLALLPRASFGISTPVPEPVVAPATKAATPVPPNKPSGVPALDLPGER